MKVEKLKLKDFLGNDIYIMQAVVFADSEYGNGYYLKMDMLLEKLKTS